MPDYEFLRHQFPFMAGPPHKRPTWCSGPCSTCDPIEQAERDFELRCWTADEMEKLEAEITKLEQEAKGGRMFGVPVAGIPEGAVNLQALRPDLYIAIAEPKLTPEDICEAEEFAAILETCPVEHLQKDIFSGTGDKLGSAMQYHGAGWRFTGGRLTVWQLIEVVHKMADLELNLPVRANDNGKKKAETHRKAKQARKGTPKRRQSSRSRRSSRV